MLPRAFGKLPEFRWERIQLTFGRRPTAVVWAQIQLRTAAVDGCDPPSLFALLVVLGRHARTRRTKRKAARRKLRSRSLLPL